MNDVGGGRERGAAFLSGCGDAFAAAAGPALAVGGPVADAVALLDERRSESGAFADEPGGEVSLSATRRALWRLADLRVHRGPAVEAACVWLEGQQADDGGFADGAEETRLWETGLLAGVLARSPCARSRVLDAAGDFLASRFDPDRVQGLHWEPLASWGAAFANLSHDEADGILQWCGRELERGFRARGFDALRAARVLCFCDTPVLPGSRLEPGEILSGVLDAQCEDGSWEAPPGVGQIEASLDAMVALSRFAPPTR